MNPHCMVQCIRCVEQFVCLSVVHACMRTCMCVSVYACVCMWIVVFIPHCRAYGAVFKAMHKESGQLLAIKQVPVDSDLQEIIKEISIMQQCDSPYVVKYFGSYFKNADLWVCNVCSILCMSR